jgi:hypothetical protein
VALARTKGGARRVLAAVLVGVAWTASGSADSSPAHQREESVVRSGRLWTIVPESEVARLIRPCSRHVPEGLSGAWTPSVEEVERAEAALAPALARALAAATQEQRRATIPDKRHPEGPPAYYRQYGGAMRGQTRVLYINAIAQWMVERRPALFRRWRTQAIRACDLALNAFGAVVEPTKGAFESFDFDY